MKSALTTLSRIKKFELDEQQRLLVAEQEKEDQLNFELKSLISKYEEEKLFVAQNPGICDFGLYTDQYLKKRKSLEKQIHDIQLKIEQIRDVMSGIYKEQKTFDIVAENRRKLKQKELDDQELKHLDEVGTNTYIKKHQN